MSSQDSMGNTFGRIETLLPATTWMTYRTANRQLSREDCSCTS